jgi:transcriptional regulator with XRE-family HTH domain
MDLKRIRQVREQKHITQAKLAEAIGVTPGQISRFESGQRRLHVDEARKIAEFLRLDLSEIIESKTAPLWKERGMKISVLTIPEGRATVEYPANLTPQSREAVAEWLALIAKLAIRA